jgi:hypothetical protein
MPEGLIHPESRFSTKSFPIGAVEEEGKGEEKTGGSGFDIDPCNIELNSIVAGITGWGLASSRSSCSGAILNRKGFKDLEREELLRRFLRWRNGKFEH